MRVFLALGEAGGGGLEAAAIQAGDVKCRRVLDAECAGAMAKPRSSLSCRPSDRATARATGVESLRALRHACCESRACVTCTPPAGRKVRRGTPQAGSAVVGGVCCDRFSSPQFSPVTHPPTHLPPSAHTSQDAFRNGLYVKHAAVLATFLHTNQAQRVPTRFTTRSRRRRSSRRTTRTRPTRPRCRLVRRDPEDALCPTSY